MAVVRLIVGKLSVGIWGEGGRKEVGICDGGSSLVDCCSGLVVLGVAVEKGIEKRGRNLGRGGVESLTSRVSILMGSFSEMMSVVVVEESGEDTKGL